MGRVLFQREIGITNVPDAYRALADGVSDGVAFGEAGRILWASDLAARLLGVADPSKLIGMPLDDLLVDVGEGLPVADGPPVVCGVRVPGATGVRARVSWKRLRDDPVRALYVIQNAEQAVVAQDELTRLAAALQRAQLQILELREEIAANAADRADWVTVLAHELRTPLTVISGYNRLMLSGDAGPVTAEQTRFLAECSKSCRRLDAFIGSLLDAAHDGFLEKGLEIDRNDIGASIRDVCDLLRPIVEEKGVEVVVDVDPAARFALFDTIRIEQVLTNLLSNAIRYTKPGGTLRVVTRIGADSDAAGIEVCVIDQGPGIPPDDRDRIFEPFVQLAPSSQGDGIGLGLAICRRIVRAHGGAIHVSDEPGGGCRFVFSLPNRPSTPGVG